LRTTRSLFVHFSIDEVTIWSIVAGVQCAEPFALPVGCSTTSNLLCIGPNQLGVVSIGGSKLEWFYFVFAKESDLIIPVCDCPLPVCVSQSDALLVDVQILTNTKSVDLSTICTIMSKDTLISMGLSYSSKFIIPHHLSHVSSRRLRSRSPPSLLAHGNL